MLEFQRRKAISSSLEAWCRACDLQPAAHHKLLLNELEKVERGETNRLIVCMPPGSAKSTYISKQFPPWFLARRANRSILACSYAYELIEGFGRNARNLIELHGTELGIALRKDSKAAGEWETTNGGRYFCAGVNAGIAGHRADCAFIDDPIGSDQDARSQTYRDHLWKWFWDDFIPRLKPGGAVVIIANRRHEDDLVGRLISAYPADWKVIKLPLVIDTEEQAKNDAMGRSIGQHLWPEWFKEQTITDARKSENFSGLYQQDPTPEDGDYFHKDWFEPAAYDSIDKLPKDLRHYVASDHALTSKEENDRNCLIPFGVDEHDDIWILPDLWWKRGDTLELSDAMFDIVARRRPIEWFAESEHIHKSIEPFINKRMQETGIYFTLTGLTSSKDLQTRAQSIRGRAKMLKVHLPRFAHWYQQALHELMTFPLGKHDDFIAALAKIGQGLERLARASVPKAVVPFDPDKQWVPTFGWLKESDKRMRKTLGSYGGR